MFTIKWLDDHYDAAEDHSGFICKRCGAKVSYVTKHAALRHGDDIEVSPVKDQSLAGAY